MFYIIIQIFVLFTLIGTGYFCKKAKLISNNMNQDVSSLLVYVSIPSLIIVSLSSLSFTEELWSEIYKLLLISLFFYLIFIILSYFFVRILNVKGTTRNVFQFGIVFGNTSFMGFPVASAVFGEQGVFFMAVCDVLFAVFVWTFGVAVMNRREEDHESGNKGNLNLAMLKLIINPSIVAVFIGFILLFTSTKLPGPIYQPLQILGNMTTPLSMIFIGSVLGDTEVWTVFKDRELILCSLQRLILLPVIVFILLKLFHFSRYLLNIPVLYWAMPVAAFTSIISTKYGSDFHLASKLIFVSTVLSMVTIPLVIWVLVYYT